MLLIALIVAFWVQRGAVDITSMITGNPPPSKTYRDARGDSAEDGPLVRTLKGWWADAIEDIDEVKRRRRLDTKEEKERERARRKAERQRVIREAEERERRINEPKAEAPPAPEREAVVTEPDPNSARPFDPLDPPFGEGVLEPEETVGGTEPEPASSEVPERDGTEREVIVERSREAVGSTPTRQPPTIEGIIEPEHATGPDGTETEIFEVDVVEDESRPELNEPEEPFGPVGPEIPALRIIQGGEQADDTEWSAYKPQLYAVQDQGNGDKEMTVVHGSDQQGGMTYTSAGQASSANVEGGITTHINWTQDVADYQLRAAGHVEIVWASMFQGENGPERLAKINRIQEMHRQLREMYLELNGTLTADKNTVGDAYAATRNQAGGKAYTTS